MFDPSMLLAQSGQEKIILRMQIKIGYCISYLIIHNMDNPNAKYPAQNNRVPVFIRKRQNESFDALIL